MAETVIKGEVHTSRGDFQEERALLAQGVDTLVIEGHKEKTELGWLHGWFGVAMVIFEYLFASFLYTDHQTLVDIAKGQNADIVYTRETNRALIENSHKLIVSIAFLLFYFFLILSAVLGLVGERLWGGGSLLLAGLVPLLILRIYESRKSGDNRDKKIAEKIEEVAAEGGRVVAVMGESHAKRVPEYLPDDVNPDVREPQYGFLSVPMARDLAVPAARMVGMMAVVYPAYLAVFEISVAFI